MKMENRASLRIITVLVLAVLVLGGCVPVPTPVPDVGESRALSDRYFESLYVDKEFVSNGTTTLNGTVTMAGSPAYVSSVVFEGATADAYETTLTITDPTSSDKTITFPNSTGTVALNPYGESIEFEGATANEFETTLAVADPGADVTLTLPAETAAVVVSSLTTNATDAANAVTGASNGLVFEGSAADANETTLSATNPTADRSVVFADGGGTVMLSSLATNATDAANAVTGASNGLVFEGATANEFETTVAPTDPTADVTLTLPNETGTVALTSQAVDMTLEADSTGGNAGAKTEFIGLPRIKLIGSAQGTNPASQTIALVDDSPTGEFAAVDASVTLSADGTYYKYGSNSLKAIWDVGAVATDGFLDANLGAGVAWDDMESVGLLVYSTATWAAGDLTLVLTDDGGARTYNIPALTAANAWTWLEIDISAGDLSAVSDVAILLSAAGETALGAFSMYIDIGYVWDAVDEEALGVAIQQDGVLGVINTESGAQLAELTDYLVHYESGVDFLVYISDQSTADIAVLAAY